VMEYLVVASWNGDNQITAENRAPDEAAAVVMRDIMISEGYTNAFLTPMPAGGSGYWTVDPISNPKTVTYDPVAENTDVVMDDWQARMSATDPAMPRSTEDIYDALQEDAQARVPQITRDRITAKKTLRGEKP
jgi:hypothetical protein